MIIDVVPFIMALVERTDHELRAKVPQRHIRNCACESIMSFDSGVVGPFFFLGIPHTISDQEFEIPDFLS